MVDDFQPPEYLSVGTMVDLPITIRCYMRRGGAPAYGLTINRRNMLGEIF